ncbi:MAG: VWA domain-containing protein [Acidobacteriaceae bacterium]|nr:VWA domain-containing protein [Acidobacteriaceae bacterium]
MTCRRYAAAGVFAVALCAQQPSTIRVPVRLVSVPTLVASRDGKYIAGLSTTDFTVTDNDHLQNISVDVNSVPVSLVVVLQANQAVRDYLAFIQNTGALLDDSLAAATGQAALLTYGDEIAVTKPFAQSELRSAMQTVSPSGTKALMLDAGLRAVGMLKERPNPTSRVLLFIGQPYDDGSSAKLEALESRAEEADVQIYALTLPLLGKTFVSDAFGLTGLGSQGYRGGYEARVELTKAVPALRRTAEAGMHSDPFSFLTIASGGLQLHFRKQKQLEDAIIGLGDALRSRYILSYRPDPYTAGFHKIVVQADVPGAIVYSRPGYEVTEAAR